jgi:hypothetical protein
MRRILKASIKFLSLVRRGANNMPVVYKSEEPLVEVRSLSKAQDNGELLVLCYPPDYRDAEGDIAAAEVVKEMAYEFARNGSKLDVFHDGKELSREQAFVAESFIIQKGDPRFAGWKDYDGKIVDPTDSWGAVIKINDLALREEVKNQKISGVSVYGPAVVALNKSDSKTAETKEMPQMDLEKIIAELRKANEALVAKVAELVKPAADPAQATKIAELEKSVKELTDAKTAGAARVVELEKSMKELTDAKTKAESDLAAALKASGQTARAELTKTMKDAESVVELASKYLRK